MGTRNFGDNYAAQEKYYASDEYKNSLKPYSPPKTVTNTKKETSTRSPAKSGVNSKRLNYPLGRSLDSDTDYLQIEIAEYKAPQLNLQGFEFQGLQEGGTTGEKIFNKDSTVNTTGEGSFALNRGSESNAFPKKKLKDIKHIITLPIPRNVTDTQGVQYGEGSLNPLEALGTAAVANAVSFGGNIDALKKSVTAVFSKGGDSITDPQTQANIAAAISGTAIGALGGNVDANQLISRASGQILNPNLELLFNGVGLRTFPFSFQFFPRNRSEGLMVMDILRVLKFEMAPSRTTEAGAGIFIKAPSIFQLTYKKGKEDHPFLNRFLPTVLSDMKVNYTASGSHSTFYDGTPTHMQVDLQFKELNPIFKEDYENAGGVGY